MAISKIHASLAIRSTKRKWKTINQQTTSNSEIIPEASSGWDNQEDYIHRQKEDEDVPEKSDMAIPEDKEETKRSGEYEVPPPPE